jgi:hypothetical protein
MPTSSRKSLGQYVLSELLDMAAGLGELRAHHHSSTERITAIEREIAALRAHPGSTEGPMAQALTMASNMASLLPMVWHMAWLMISRGTTLWFLLHGYLSEVVKWVWGLL